MPESKRPEPHMGLIGLVLILGFIGGAYGIVYGAVEIGDEDKFTDAKLLYEEGKLPDYPEMIARNEKEQEFTQKLWAIPAAALGLVAFGAYLKTHPALKERQAFGDLILKIGAGVVVLFVFLAVIAIIAFAVSQGGFGCKGPPQDCMP